MTEQEYEVIKRVAIDTAPRRRTGILRHLLDGQWHRTKEVASAMDIPQMIATRELEDLMMIQVVKREPDLLAGEELTQTTPYKWQLRNEISELITKTGLLSSKIPLS